MTAKSRAACIRPEAAAEADPRWARVLARDRSADGEFWYSVATTGVYCRPSCPSRAANPRNVGLHNSLTEAKATGFRPCKRCNPDGPSAHIENAAIAARACRLIEKSEEVPSLKRLAQGANLSTSYFHRVFKSVTGLTPKDYAEAHQASRVRDRLARGGSVTEAMYDAGFNSSGRFYEKSWNMLGMTPTQYRAGGANENIRFAVGQSSLGAVLVACSDKGVVSILIGENADELVRDLQDRFPNALLVGGDREYQSMVVRVVGFVETPQIGLNLPLDVRGVAFQRRVWQALQDMRIDQNCSRSEFARSIGAPQVVRAPTRLRRQQQGGCYPRPRGDA
jgi:AraC family transcriptional regulator of adaptative response/methylated-DNA-[protein]-cysteine methyltransferase